MKMVNWGNPIYIVKSFIKQRYLIGQMVRRDLGQRYKGSYLGFLWSIINPLLMLLIYTFVFSVIFKSRWPNTSGDLHFGEYAVIMFSGLIPFNLFSEVINRAPVLVLNNTNYVKKVVFPLEILVVVALGSALITSLINIGIILFASLLILNKVPPTIVFLPLAYVPLILLSLGFGWFLASLGVFIRDIGQIVGLAMQILIFVSPVFYPDTNIPGNLHFLLLFNPMSVIVTSFRNTLMWGQMIPLKEWALWCLIGLFITILGYIWFIATKKGFADVV